MLSSENFDTFTAVTMDTCPLRLFKIYYLESNFKSLYYKASIFNGKLSQSHNLMNFEMTF